ncbi:AraC family transcriptional regulator [Fulvivirga maritima]|uniref:helix-turn-helix domain-containing protein n=1 Tax=Fulvivirga maritima TaxID=2904247 RepID=UPI001F28CD0A|nr:AraC family transcriptional regulator [Fulvivirga maritima]UII25588.1 AraC family transcriptional regulator [Fulvivirga maritima]
MKTIRFTKTACSVDFLLNVLSGKELVENYAERDAYCSDSFEVLFFNKAAGSLLVNNKEYQVTDNTLVFLSPFQKRQWKLEPDSSDFTLLIFQEEFLNEFFSDKLFTYRLLYFYQLEHPCMLGVDVRRIINYQELVSEIKSELVNVRPDSQHIIRSLIYYLLQKINRRYALEYGLAIDAPGDDYAFQFKKLMEQHIYKKQRLADYTDLMGISRITLNTSVKARFNVTASHLLKQRLFFEIQNLLLYSDKSVSQIAQELNFSEPNHLMRFFKKQSGMTTSEFLQSYQNGIEA